MKKLCLTCGIKHDYPDPPALPPVRSEPWLAFADSVRNALYVLVEVINEQTDTPEETPAYLDKYLDAVDKAFDELKANKVLSNDAH